MTRRCRVSRGGTTRARASGSATSCRSRCVCRPYRSTGSTIEERRIGTPAAASSRCPRRGRWSTTTGNTWKPVTPTGEYGTALDRYNRVEFTPVVTAALRLMVQLHPHRSAGLYAWKVFDGQTQLVPTTSAAAEQMLATGVAMPAAEGAAAAETWFKPELLSDIRDGRSITLWRDDASGCNDARASSPDTAPTLVQNAIRRPCRGPFRRREEAVARLPALRRRRLYHRRGLSQPARRGHRTGVLPGAALVQGEIGGETDDFGLSLNANGKLLAGTGKPDRSIASPPGVNDGQPHLAVFTRIKATGALRYSSTASKLPRAKAARKA